jgi:NAD(P)-dependent dehydrogenase (short-subunit alcohol dehydrogenase family)
MKQFQHAIVVGASSGLGRALAEKLAASGCRVGIVARRTDRLRELADRFPGQVLPFGHSVTNYDEVPALFQDICRQLGGLDLFIYASGTMPEVGPTEFNFRKDAQIVDVNIKGAIAWLNEAAVRFGNTRRGSIVAIGSLAGDRGRAGQPAYNMSKAALATYMEALRNRLSRFGVKVVTIKPGPMQTEMTSRLHLRNAMSAEAAAQIILRKCNKTGEHYLRFSHRILFTVIRNIPSWIFRRLNI